MLAASDAFFQSETLTYAAAAIALLVAALLLLLTFRRTFRHRLRVPETGNAGRLGIVTTFALDQTLARHTCFCGALRSATIALSRRRSARVTLTTIPALIMRAWTASADLGIVRMNQTTSNASFAAEVQSNSEAAARLSGLTAGAETAWLTASRGRAACGSICPWPCLTWFGPDLRFGDQLRVANKHFKQFWCCARVARQTKLCPACTDRKKIAEICIDATSERRVMRLSPGPGPRIGVALPRPVQLSFRLAREPVQPVSHAPRQKECR